MKIRGESFFTRGTVIKLVSLAILATAAAFGGIKLSHNDSSLYNEKSVACMSYTIREYDGRIGIFQTGSTVPEEVLDVYLITLPNEDVARLQNGIKAEGQDEISALIEDFSG